MSAFRGSKSLEILRVGFWYVSLKRHRTPKGIAESSPVDFGDFNDSVGKCSNADDRFLK